MLISTFVQSLAAKLSDPESQQGMKSFLYAAQIGLGVGFVLLVLKLRSGRKSGFAVREADLKKQTQTLGKDKGPDLANSRIERKVPLALEGISLAGPPHEVLGVALGATEVEIQRAYRERMKRYHPDKIGRPGTREWNDAQKIAEAINQAKDELMKRARART